MGRNFLATRQVLPWQEELAVQSFRLMVSADAIFPIPPLASDG
jgi:hypothetical protein